MGTEGGKIQVAETRRGAVGDIDRSGGWVLGNVYKVSRARKEGLPGNPGLRLTSDLLWAACTQATGTARWSLPNSYSD